MTHPKNTETLCQVTINSMVDQIVVIDLNGNILMANGAWRKFSIENSPEPGKLFPGTDIGDNYLEAFQSNLAIAAEENVKIRDGIEAVLDGRLPSFNIEYSCQTANQRRWFKMHVSPLSSNYEGVVISHSNITGFKLIEGALRLSEERFRTMFDQAPLGVALIDSYTGHIYEVNSKFASIAGRSREEMAHIDWMSITHPDDMQEDLDNMARLNAGEISGFYMEKRYIRPDGSFVWIGMTITPLKEIDGQHTCHLCMIDDITDRKNANAAIYESEERFRSLANAAPTLIWVAGSDKLCNWFNATWFEYTGRTMAQELGNGWVEGVHPDDVARCIEIYVSHFDDRQPFQMEYRLRGQNGDYRWFIDVGCPRFDAQGQFVGYIGMLTDISKQRVYLETIERERKNLFSILEELPGFVYLQAPDYSIRYANRYFRERFGDPENSVCYERICGRNKPCEECPTFRVFECQIPQQWETTAAQDGSIYQIYDYPIAGQDGSPLVLELGIDITERKKTENALKEKEERLSLATLHNRIGIWDWNLETLEMVWDDSMFALYNLRRDDFSGAVDAWEKLLHPGDRERSDHELQDALSGGKPFDTEFRVVWPNGEVRHIKAVAKVFWDVNGKPLRMLGTNLDITERKRLEDELKRQARIDFLTGLSNRRYFMEQAEQELSRANRYDNPLSIFMMDVDFFKQVNDGHGHKVGDSVLKKFAEICVNTLRDVDIIGRIGGEEFAILLPETDKKEAAEVAERLRDAISKAKVPLPTPDQSLHFTISIGVVSISSKSDNLDVLLNLADKALYEAKNSGRNRVCVAH